VVVEADHDFVFVGDGAQSLGGVFGDFAGNASCAEGFGYFEVVVDLFVAHPGFSDVAEFYNVDVDACIVVHFTEGYKCTKCSQRLCSGELFDWTAHKFDRAYPAFDGVLEDVFGGTRHGAIAVSNGADLHAVEF